MCGYESEETVSLFLLRFLKKKILKIGKKCKSRLLSRGGAKEQSFKRGEREVFVRTTTRENQSIVLFFEGVLSRRRRTKETTFFEEDGRREYQSDAAYMKNIVLN